MLSEAVDLLKLYGTEMMKVMLQRRAVYLRIEVLKLKLNCVVPN